MVFFAKYYEGERLAASTTSQKTAMFGLTTVITYQLVGRFLVSCSNPEDLSFSLALSI